MQPGTFLGIENNVMKIEYEVSVSANHRSKPLELATEKRIFSYPVGGDSYRDTFFRGFGSREGTIGFGPNLPNIGQKVFYDSPSPDGAGHMMVVVCAKGDDYKEEYF